ncbi:MAG: cysteine synthase A [Oscillospiraceae bacterium]|nr:cysteine synthase A [Oscillospiraceae bacterium]
MAVFESARELIGKTPLLRLNNFEKKRGALASLYAKLERFNPAGSSKDRVGKKMIEDAEKRGLLKKGGTIIEPTSGNTGLGICAVAVPLGYRVIITMPETMSEERKIMMRAFGAELVLTDGAKGMSGAIEKAQELSREIPNSFIPSQFENPANAQAHFETTGPEIWEDLDGNVDIFVAGVGTGGTITGVGRFLKSKKSDVKIIAVEPDTSPVLSGGSAGAHALQGIGAGFVPKVLDTEIYDEIITVSKETAFSEARELCKSEGVLVGISSGAALAAAAELSKREENVGKNIVVLLPDTGERYLSTELFKD